MNAGLVSEGARDFSPRDLSIEFSCFDFAVLLLGRVSRRPAENISMLTNGLLDLPTGYVWGLPAMGPEPRSKKDMDFALADLEHGSTNSPLPSPPEVSPSSSNSSRKVYQKVKLLRRLTC